MGKILVLYYHKVCNIERDWNGLAVSTGTFMKQMEYIKEHYGILRAEDDWDGCEKDSVIVTFDDGYEDNYTNALPILEKLEIPATFFVSTGNIDTDAEIWCSELVWLILEGSMFEDRFVTTGTTFEFEYRTDTPYKRMELYRILRSILPGLSQKDREQIMEDIRIWGHASDRKKRNTHRVMTSGQIKQLSDSRYATIGAHTVNHPSLGGLAYEEQYDEIAGSKTKLESIIQKKVEIFSYPFGVKEDYSGETVGILKKLGFTKAMTTEHSCIKNFETGMYEIPRVCVKECGMEMFYAKLERFFGRKSGEDAKPVRRPFEYVGRIEDDQSLFDQNASIAIWGAGGRGRWVLDKLESWKLLDKVKCIYDSAGDKKGTTIKGIPVFNIAEHKEMECEILIVAITQIGGTFKQIEEYMLKNMHYYV